MVGEQSATEAIAENGAGVLAVEELPAVVVLASPSGRHSREWSSRWGAGYEGAQSSLVAASVLMMQECRW